MMLDFVMSQIINKLKEAGVIPTAQRIDIANIIFAKDQHLSAEQILKKVNKHKSTVSKATVYNTLGLFAKKGLVNEVLVDASKVFYDSNVTRHFHFYNDDTNELMDIPADKIQIDQLQKLPEGTTAANIEIIVHIKNS